MLMSLYTVIGVSLLGHAVYCYHHGQRDLVLPVALIGLGGCVDAMTMVLGLARVPFLAIALMTLGLFLFLRAQRVARQEG
jgi:hypothetical protein